MGSIRELENIPYRNIPRSIKLVYIIREQIPKVAAIEAGPVNVHQSDKDFWINKVEFLKKRVDFTNKLASLDGHITLHVVLTLQKVAKVLDLFYPGKRIIVEDDWSYIMSVLLFG